MKIHERTYVGRADKGWRRHIVVRVRGEVRQDRSGSPFRAQHVIGYKYETLSRHFTRAGAEKAERRYRTRKKD